MKIVTGYTGTPHINANDDQAFNQGIFGKGNYVLDVGNKFNATLSNTNTVVIEDGDGVIQGVHFRLEPGTTENVSIDSGTAGYNRIDYICARYTKDPVSNVENISLVVVKGTPSGSTPTPPTYNSGDILIGDTPVDMPLWKVTLTGLTPALSRFEKPSSDVSATVNIIYPVGSIYMSVNATNPSQLFGGTWVQLKDRFLLGAGDTYANGATGGEAAHTLTVNEMPSHDHHMTYAITGATSSPSQVEVQSGQSAVLANINTFGEDWTDSKGGSQAHNNMPPYLAVYMWKRTA